MNSLQERIRLALSRAGFNAATLAKRAKVSRGTVSLWVNGPTQMIEGDNLTRAATVLGVDAHWLSTGEGLPYAEEPMRVEEPGAAYKARTTTTITDLLDTLHNEINPLPDVIRNCVSQLIANYLSGHNPETKAQAAEAIKRLMAK